MIAVSVTTLLVSAVPLKVTLLDPVRLVPRTMMDSQTSVAELIDDLTQIDSESVAIHSSYLPPVGFIVDETPVSLRTSREGIVVPDPPPQMRELVRRGPVALPELIKHLDDKRPTKLEVGRPAHYGFFGRFFGDMYDPRVRDWEQKGPPLPRATGFPTAAQTRRTFGLLWPAMWTVIVKVLRSEES